jgi:two-component system chemotaxis response regulator CheY
MQIERNRAGAMTQQTQKTVLTILTVDDSPSIRQMLTYVLETNGYRVLQASDGAEGLEVARSNKVDMILTDQNMPKMDGLSLIRELRALPAYEKTPIVMLTTESSLSMKEQGRGAGATGWMVKPFDPERLVEMLRKVIG